MRPIDRLAAEETHEKSTVQKSGKASMLATMTALAAFSLLSATNAHAQMQKADTKPKTEKRDYEKVPEFTEEQKIELGKILEKTMEDIKLLSHPKYITREKTMKRMTEELNYYSGIMLTHMGVQSSDPEISSRSMKILKDADLSAIISTQFPPQKTYIWTDGETYDPQKKCVSLPEKFVQGLPMEYKTPSSYQQKAVRNGIPQGGKDDEWPAYTVGGQMLEAELTTYFRAEWRDSSIAKKAQEMLKSKKFTTNKERLAVVATFLIIESEREMRDAPTQAEEVLQPLYRGSQAYRKKNKMRDLPETKIVYPERPKIFTPKENMKQLQNMHQKKVKNVLKKAG